MKTHRLLTLVAGLMLAGAAQAQQVVSYFAQIPQTATNWTKVLQLPGFDTTLGTLSQVKLSYSGEAWQSLFAENTGASGSTYNLTTTATLTVGKQGGPTLVSLAPLSFNRTGSVAAFDGSLDFAGTSGVTFSQHVTGNGVFFDSDLASYLSASPLNFSASASGISTLISGGNFAKGASTSAAASLGVEYTYTAIPEPSTYAVILGLTALGFVTIRRRMGLVVD